MYYQYFTKFVKFVNGFNGRVQHFMTASSERRLITDRLLNLLELS
jgi:hypothetical protein